MAWFKLDDGFEAHPKVKALPRGAARLRAIGLWTLAGTWSARGATDGSIPAYMLAEIGGSKADADNLVRVGLWHAAGHACDRCTQPDLGGYQFHDWAEFQPTREQRDAIREAKRRAGAIGGAASGRSRREALTEANAKHSAAKQTNSRPDPTRTPKTPTPPTRIEATENATKAAADKSAESFEEFWLSYPRRVGKGQARRAWAAALKKSDATTIATAALAYTKRCQGTEQRFIAHPATWLNGERWLDDLAAPTRPQRQPGEVEWG